MNQNEQPRNIIIILQTGIKGLFRFIKSSPLYILWFIIYYDISIRILFPFFRAHSFVISLVFFVVSIAVALFAGDEIFKLLEGIRPPRTKREKEYLIPIFEDVYEGAKEMHPDLPKMQIHIIDDMTVNAFAFGRKTIAVTQGAIETFTEEELKGVIAHEISHIYHGDTKAQLINTIGNGATSVLAFCIKQIIKLLELVARVAKSTVIEAVFNFIRFIFEMIVYVLLLFGNILLSVNSRKNEYTADRFACEIGYGDGLISGLYLLQKMSLGEDKRIISRMQASHPHIASRIERLENLEDNTDMIQP